MNTLVVLAHLLHIPPGSARPGEPIELVAVIDAPAAEPALVVHWRAIGGAIWRDAPFERSSAGGWYATIPAASPPGVEYYIGEPDHAHFASAASPQQITVEPELIDRLEDQERARTRDLPDQVALDLEGHDFGNRYGHSDYYARAELSWTHRFLRTLDAASFGAGGITGRTPSMDGADATIDPRDARYGFAAARLRLAPAIFVDARATVGVSQEGFMKGFGGSITLGRPWRSNLSFGGEALDALGGSAFVRLQWDTAPPLLMGASIVRTDLPGALVSADGLLLRYDVSYTVAARFTIRGALSYGARDGSAHFGGGLGTAIAF
ncbi:MAG TPA: hypothetical protein VL463_18315 [Kofleriaceae bacterium]|jgi:hypothetical protein|nr:hypothetical protein [Kofleriaceae bacterium]